MKILAFIIGAVMVIVLLCVCLGLSGGNEGCQEDGVDDVGPGYFD